MADNATTQLRPRRHDFDTDLDTDSVFVASSRRRVRQAFQNQKSAVPKGTAPIFPQ
jgi:hypothetical protein